MSMFEKVTSVSDFLLRFDDLEFYQKPYYLRKEADLIGGDFTYFIFEEDSQVMSLPLLKRRIDSDRKEPEFDLSSPYGYPGFLSTKNDLNFIQRGFNHFCDLARKEGFVSSFIRLNPFYNNILLQESATIHQQIHGSVVSVDLKDSYNSIFSSYSSNHRRDVRKLKKTDYKIIEGNLEDLSSFISIYNETMDRLEANDNYYFERDYYENLFRNEEGYIDLIFALDENHYPVSTALFLRNEKLIEYHLGATLTKNIKDAPIKMIFDYVIEKYSNSNLELNMGGGVGSQSDSLYKFKSGFSPLNRKFSTVRVVHDSERYKDLCSNYSKSEKKDLGGYFPLYRF